MPEKHTLSVGGPVAAIVVTDWEYLISLTPKYPRVLGEFSINQPKIITRGSYLLEIMHMLQKILIQIRQDPDLAFTM